MTMSPLQEKSSEMDNAAVCDSDHERGEKEPTPLHLPVSPHTMSRRGPSLPPSDQVRARDDLWIGIMSPPCLRLSTTDPHRPLLLTTERRKSKQILCPRRSIFSGMIKNNPSPSTQLSSPTQSPRKVIDFHRFDPSTKFLHESGEHYKPIAKLPSCYAYLPTLPTPLKRFYLEDGSAACLSGTYPLQRLPSILRQSYCKRPVGFDDEKEHNHPAETITGYEPLNLTNSVRLHPQKNSSHVCNEEDTAPNTTSPSSWEANHVVFDPRITVIEFKDDFQRQWISEAELERFKRETISLAEDYLKKHPEMIEMYSTPVKDSVTCTLRRRALYSLPIMSQCDCDNQNNGNSEGDGRPEDTEVSSEGRRAKD